MFASPEQDKLIFISRDQLRLQEFFKPNNDHNWQKLQPEKNTRFGRKKLCFWDSVKITENELTFYPCLDTPHSIGTPKSHLRKTSRTYWVSHRTDTTTTTNSLRPVHPIHRPTPTTLTIHLLNYVCSLAQPSGLLMTRGLFIFVVPTICSDHYFCFPRKLR